MKLRPFPLFRAFVSIVTVLSMAMWTPSPTLTQASPGQSTVIPHTVTTSHAGSGTPRRSAPTRKESGRRNVKPATPSAITYYLPWYDSLSTSDYVYIANPASNGTSAPVRLTIGAPDAIKVSRSFTITAGGLYTGTYVSDGNSQQFMAGPIIVTSTLDIPLVVYQRSFLGQVPMDVPAFSSDDVTGLTALSSNITFPWYDATLSQNDDWIMVGNPNGSTVTVDVTLAGALTQTLTLAPGHMQSVTFNGQHGGPVVARSEDSSNIYAFQRVVVGGSLNEMTGIPAESVESTYAYPWIDNNDGQRRDYVMLYNPHAFAITVQATLAPGSGSPAHDSATVGPFGVNSLGAAFAGLRTGPLVITSTSTFYTSKRTLWQSTLSEIPGLPSDSWSSHTAFALYDVGDAFNGNDWVCSLDYPLD